MPVKSKQEQFYERYQHLADYYAKKVWETGNIGMDRDDIEQELRIKLFLAIKTYAKKWAEYRRTGRLKPIPIEFYLKTVMLNKVRDFIKEINKTDYCDLDTVYNLQVNQQEVFEISKLDIKVGFQKISDLFPVKRRKRIMKLYFLYKFDVNKIIKYGPYEKKKDNEEYVRMVVKEGLETIRKYLEASS